MPTTESFYESSKAISEYLLFHYGEERHFLLEGIGPVEALDFSKRCADLATRHPVATSRALDLGCAVGRSACELSERFDETIGIDFSHGLIDAARSITSGNTLQAEIADEGDLSKTIELRMPLGTRPEKLRFEQGDAMNLSPQLGRFDFVLMANLIDRLPNPRACLESIGSFLNDNGVLAITSPYTWLAQYTPREHWLGGYEKEGRAIRTYDTLKEILAPAFEEIEEINMPFLIREHTRKNQYSIAHATLWRKRKSIHTFHKC